MPTTDPDIDPDIEVAPRILLRIVSGPAVAEPVPVPVGSTIDA